MSSLETSTPAVAATATTTADTRSDRWLLVAGALFTVAVLLHDSDHARRGVASVGRDVFWLGTSSMLLEVAIVVLIAQRHRLAPLVAAGSGFTLAAGYLFVHVLPARPWLSDSFTSATDVSPLSWTAASIEIAAALALGAVGVLALRDRGGLASAMAARPQQRTLVEALRHPLVVVMIVGNLVILGISLSQF